MNIQEIFLDLKPNISYQNFRFLMSGKLASSLILRYLIRKNNINPKLNEILVPKLMGWWVYSNIQQNIQLSTRFSKYTKIMWLYHQFGIPQKSVVRNFAKENKLIVIEDCAHVLKANFDDGKSDVFNDEYSILSFSKFVDCSPLGGLQSSNQDFLKIVDQEINQSSKFQSIIINILLKMSKLFKSNKLLHDKLYGINYSLWNYPSKNLDNKIIFFKKNIKNEMKRRNERFLIFKNELKEKNHQDYFNYNELICQKLPLVINDEKIKKSIVDKFEQYKFPYEILTYDINRNFLDPKFEKTVIINHSNNNLSFEKQIEVIRKIT